MAGDFPDQFQLYRAGEIGIVLGRLDEGIGPADDVQEEIVVQKQDVVQDCQAIDGDAFINRKLMPVEA